MQKKHLFLADTESLRLADCIIQLDQWMSKNRLKLNADKTQLILPGTRQQLTKLTLTQLRLTSSSPVYTIQPVVKPVVKPI